MVATRGTDAQHEVTKHTQRVVRLAAADAPQASDERLVMQVKDAIYRGGQAVLIRLQRIPPFGHGGPRAVVGARDARGDAADGGAGGARRGRSARTRGWAEMSDGEKKAAGALGCDEASWEEGLVPEACTKRWETLEAHGEGGGRLARLHAGGVGRRRTAAADAVRGNGRADAARGGARAALQCLRCLGGAGGAATGRSARRRRRPRPPPRRGRRGPRQGQGVGRHDAGERDAAAAIGYAARGATRARRRRRRRCGSRALSADQRSAVLVLGYTKRRGMPRWTRPPAPRARASAALAAAASGETAGKDKSWADMTTGERDPSVIGFDEAAWEEGRVPVLCTHAWDSLEGQHRSAAIVLG